ncbi:MAG TPA: lamin tail domain-containing protein [Pyrinomonadaceae bacterium]|jgi:hypothetical protein|nr:lamin tail domain-containing protein [Pyrinomonadaceae bacterium]
MRWFLFFAIFIPFSAYADDVITEIMYDLQEGSDGGREWIEVYNAGNTAVTLTDWKLFENGTNHKISGEGVLTPGAYAVIADNPSKFKNDWPSFAGLMFDSAFSLGNEGESISLRDGALVDLASAVFSSGLGGNGTGDSLQRLETGAPFRAGIPTPGAEIPAGGLVQTPSKKESRKSSTAAAATSKESAVVGELVAREESNITIPAQSSSILLWLFGVCGLSAAVAGGIVCSRVLKRDEWEIIEEMPETS